VSYHFLALLWFSRFALLLLRLFPYAFPALSESMTEHRSHVAACVIWTVEHRVTHADHHTVSPPASQNLEGYDYRLTFPAHDLHGFLTYLINEDGISGWKECVLVFGIDLTSSTSPESVLSCTICWFFALCMTVNDEHEFWMGRDFQFWSFRQRSSHSNQILEKNDIDIGIRNKESIRRHGYACVDGSCN
jgi:hypothetical protein